MPIGYTTYYGGTFDNQATARVQAAALEEAMPEGTLVLLQATLPAELSAETLVDMNMRLRAAGVPPWPGYSDLVFPDATDAKKVYVCWVKGIAWMSIILAILFFVAPIVLWFLIPQSIRDMMMMMGFMAIMLPIMGMMKEVT
jgi:hypothetical protein